MYMYVLPAELLPQEKVTAKGWSEGKRALLPLSSITRSHCFMYLHVQVQNISTGTMYMQLAAL